MMMKSSVIIEKLDKMIPNPRCELEYSKDYELLIATVLSAQCKDARVNEVTKVLFNKYDIFSLQNADINDIMNIIKPVGTFRKKSAYIIAIAKSLCQNYNGIVPNNREYLTSLPGVGRKTCNLVLANIYSVPAIAVDTHVKRVSTRLGLVKASADVLKVEKKLMKIFPQDKWIRLHHQLVLFGRYICTAKNPKCLNCLFKDTCPYFKKKNT